MAVDPNPSYRPSKVRPAREHAPAGTRNVSRKESGGQPKTPGGVMQTPSMNTSRRGTKGDRWSPPQGSLPGHPS